MVARAVVVVEVEAADAKGRAAVFLRCFSVKSIQPHIRHIFTFIAVLIIFYFLIFMEIWKFCS